MRPLLFFAIAVTLVAPAIGGASEKITSPHDVLFTLWSAIIASAIIAAIFTKLTDPPTDHRR